YKELNIHAYNFANNRVPGATDADAGYWRDVGTIDAYWAASMDLISVTPSFNAYNYEWPILTAHEEHPPAKFVFADSKSNRMGIATDSLVSPGCIISGGHIDRCVLSPKVRINSFSTVSESILFDGVEVGRKARLKRVIVDKLVQIPPGVSIGYDEQEDLARGITISEGGVRVVPQDIKF
ncbi:glucose-1-phosphate adenylyltransferase, partial [bacterium]|nr:glucose-1-phosphate adenylyltransferase [bacterium]